MEFVDFRTENRRTRSSILAECEMLATLHSKGVPEDLLVKIGVAFLTNTFYASLLLDKNAILVGIREKDDLVAFVAATVDAKTLVWRIFKSHPFRSVWHGFSSILLQPSLWIPFMKALNLNAPAITSPAAEIFMITTESKYRGQNLGVKLLIELNKRLENQGIYSCYARVWSDKAAILKLYNKAGYKESGLVEFYGHRWKWMRCETSQV